MRDMLLPIRITLRALPKMPSRMSRAFHAPEIFKKIRKAASISAQGGMGVPNPGRLCVGGMNSRSAAKN